MNEIQCSCPHCHAPITTTLASSGATCPQCRINILKYPTESLFTKRALEQCPLCGASPLFRQKDFNRKLGITLVVIGVGLSYFTYGVSLLLFAALDWWIYRSVGEVGSCYQCHSVFRDFEGISKLAPFNLVLHDHYRNRLPA